MKKKSVSQIMIALFLLPLLQVEFHAFSIGQNVVSMCVEWYKRIHLNDRSSFFQLKHTAYEKNRLFASDTERCSAL